MIALAPAVERAGLRTTRQPMLPRYFALVAAGYTLVAIYGSLVPFEFTLPEDPLGAARQAIAAFQSRGAISLFDGVANVALFLPLGFLWSAAALFSGSLAERRLRSAAIIGGAALLSAAIEFVQLGLPARTFSPLDVAAETIGATVGCGAWWLGGQRLSIWLASWQVTEPRARYWNWALQLYVAAVSVWWLLPLDLTCRPGELAAKFHGNVLLKPFSEITVERAAQASFVWLLFLPVGVLFATAGRRTGQGARSERECWWLIAGFFMLLAAGQFLVLSRTSDILQIAALGIGVTAGVWLANFHQAGSAARRNDWLGTLRSQIVAFTSATLELKLGAHQRLLTWFYRLGVIAAISFVLWAATVATPGELWFAGRAIPDEPPTWPAFAVWASAMAALLLAPRFPLAAPLVFLVLSYSSFHPNAYFRAVGGQFLVCQLGWCGAWLAASRNARRLGHSSIGCWLATGYVLWALASAAYLWLDQRPRNAAMLVQVFRLIDCAAVVWMGAFAVTSQRSHGWLAVALVVSIVSGGVLFPEQMYLNHHAAILVAISLPIALHAIVTAPSMAVQIVLALVLVRLAGMLYAGQSRSAIAGAAAGLLVYAALSRYRWWLLASFASAGLAIWQLTKSSFVAERFADLVRLEPGWDSGRVEIWQYSLDAFRSFPVFGMGPGTAPHGDGDAHNSYLAVLSETGAPGLALYVLVWLATIMLLARVTWMAGNRWPGAAAKPILAAIVAHLVAGLGYSLHSMQLAFLVAGWGLAMVAGESAPARFGPAASSRG